VNEAVIHGIGGKRRLQIGDLVKLDVGVVVDGFIGDTAITVACGGCEAEAQKLMDVTASALYKGISSAKAGKRISEIGGAVWDHVKGTGFGIVREFCGHGVGRKVHEEPQVPNYVDRRHSLRMKPGWTIAIEPMVTLGNPRVELLNDGWTVVTVDRQVTAHFEHTVLITEGEPEILTQDEEGLLY
jgi:methionyl aminopeptidase